MLFLIHGIDKPNADDLREANRKKHAQYLALFKKNVICAGPTLADDGVGKTGTVIVVDMDNRPAVESFLENNPYYRAGLFETVTVQPWRKLEGIGIL
ncbi:MAG: YciI family protein [Magnetospirillum sp. WYHS-4]